VRIRRIPTEKKKAADGEANRDPTEEQTRRSSAYPKPLAALSIFTSDIATHDENF
jgi:hypothetical protein